MGTWCPKHLDNNKQQTTAMSTTIPNAVATVIAVEQPPTCAARHSPAEAAMRTRLFQEANTIVTDHNNFIFSSIRVPQHARAYERACAHVGAPPPQRHVALAAGAQPSGSVTAMLRNVVMSAPIFGHPKTYPISTSATGEGAALHFIVHKPCL